MVSLGKSNAFEISQKLGLNEDIIQNAQSFLQKEDIAFEEILKKVYEDKINLEKEKEQISNELREIHSLKEKLSRDYSNLLETQQEKIKQAKQEARAILLDAKEEANQLIKKMEHATSNQERNQLRNELNTHIKNTSFLPSEKAENSASLTKEEIHLKDEVFVISWNQIGTVISNVSKSNEVQVQMGHLKTNVSLQDLKKIKSNSKNTKNRSTASYSTISKTKTAKTEINLIGSNVEEAVFILDKFLDDCVLSKLETVRIVHGKGTRKT